MNRENIKFESRINYDFNFPLDGSKYTPYVLKKRLEYIRKHSDEIYFYDLEQQIDKIKEEMKGFKDFLRENLNRKNITKKRLKQNQKIHTKYNPYSSKYMLKKKDRDVNIESNNYNFYIRQFIKDIKDDLYKLNEIKSKNNQAQIDVITKKMKNLSFNIPDYILFKLISKVGNEINTYDAKLSNNNNRSRTVNKIFANKKEL